MSVCDLPTNIKLRIAELAITMFNNRRDERRGNFTCCRIRDATFLLRRCAFDGTHDRDMMKEYEYFTINRLGHTPTWWNKCNHDYQDERLECLQAYRDHLLVLEEHRVKIHRDFMNKVHGRCVHCDGTGDVHSPDGEWRGQCTCGAN